VWKVLNFYLSQRCGYEVKGKHRACHHDMLLKHGMKDLSIVCDGGWHDAADLAQGMANTADGTAALFLLADSLKNRRDRLYNRVLEEAEWGLDYVIKTRFGDGWRAVYSSSSIWTDGIIGNGDDIVSDAAESPYINLVSAFAESCGAYTLRKSDPILADHALKLAGEDFMFAMAQLERSSDKSHIFTHIQWNMRGWYIQCSAMPSQFQWGKPEDFALPTAFRQFLLLEKP